MLVIREQTWNKTWRSYVREYSAQRTAYLSHALFRAIETISNAIQDRLKESGWRSFRNYVKDSDSINSMRKELDDALSLFKVRGRGP